MYYLIYSILYLFSLLPFPILYLLSNFLAFILRDVTHYRKKILRKNLTIAFPEKTEKEREFIRKKFYRNLTDNFIEAIKLLSISEKSLNKRFRAENPEIMYELYKQNKNVTVILGHFFNWEYANQLYSLKVKQDFVVVYMPLKNKLFNKIFLKLRDRYNTFLVSAHKYAKEIKPFGRLRPYTVILVGDQNPGNVNYAYWTPFFGKMVPFVTGPEKSARIGKHAVAYCCIKKIKRGHYASRIELITENAFDTPKGFVTKEMVTHVEKNIKEQPDNYLWSHNRFRHEYDEQRFSRLVI